MKIVVKHVEELTDAELGMLKEGMVKEFGKNEVVYREYYPASTRYYFVMEGENIVSLGLVRPVSVTHLGKNYDILGIAHIASFVKRRGYGRALMKEIVDYLKETKKTGVGFCSQENVPFYEKCDFDIKKNLAPEFVHYDSKTGERTVNDGKNVLYLNGEDDFMKIMLETKSVAHINIPYW